MHLRKLMFITMLILMLIAFTVMLPINSQTNDDLSMLVDGNTEFAFELYHELTDGNDDNLIFSPYSISVAMAMLYAGANGDTATQIADVMHYNLPPERLHPAFGALNGILQPPEPENPTATPTEDNSAYPLNLPDELTLRIANSLWGQQGFPIEQSYLDTLSQNYDNALQTVDFAQSAEAREIIRQWIDDMTEGRITDMPPEGTITPATVLALVNAIYFRGEWTYPFTESRTYDGMFYLNDGKATTVPLMVNDFAYMRCGRGDGFYSVQLDYGYGASQRAGMLILVPDTGRFDEVANGFDAESIQEIRDGLQITNTMSFTMPRFEFASEVDLNQAFMNMGMNAPFGAEADFSGISPSGLFVDYVGHSATISVDEQGTEASGVTSVSMAVSAAISECDSEVIADRPFMFTIFDSQTSTILFMGRVMNPAE